MKETIEISAGTASQTSYYLGKGWRTNFMHDDNSLVLMSDGGVRITIPPKSLALLRKIIKEGA